MTAPSMEDMNKAIIEDGLVHVFHTWSGHLRASVACALLRAHSLGWLGMLSGDEDSVDLLWLHRPVLFLQVLNGHLCVAIEWVKGMQSSVSSLAYPNMIPWSPAPRSISSLPTCTPPAISGLCLLMRTMTSHVLSLIPLHIQT